MEIDYKQYISEKHENIIVDISIKNDFVNADSFKDDVEERIRALHFSDDTWHETETEPDVFRKTHRRITAAIRGKDLVYSIFEKNKGHRETLIIEDSFPLAITNI